MQRPGGLHPEAVLTGPNGRADIGPVELNVPGGSARLSLGYEPTEQDVKVNALVVGPAAAGNLTASPASQSVALGGPATVTVAWSGLTAGTHYLGLIEYGNGTGAVGRTIVAVDA